MGVSIIEGQAVAIGTEYCIGSTDYGQPVESGDCTQFQMRLTEATNEQLFLNPSFEDLLNVLNPDYTAWEWDLMSYNSGKPTLLSTGYIKQEIPLEVGKYYRVCVQITAISTGQALCVIPTGLTVFENGNCFDTVGTHCVYFYATSTSETFEFTATGAQGSVTLGAVSAYEISTPNVTLETCDGDSVAADFEIQIFKELATAKLCWEGIANGCYRICVNPIQLTSFNILDGSNNIITAGGRRIVTGSQTVAGGIFLGSLPLTWIQ